MLVALAGTPAEGTPHAEELFIYAELLGMKADELSARDPLPGVTEIRQALRDVDTAEHATRLSDTDLVLLAAAASEKTAATPRLELYPRDLSARPRSEDLPGGRVISDDGAVAGRTGAPGPGPVPRPERAEPADGAGHRGPAAPA